MTKPEKGVKRNKKRNTNVSHKFADIWTFMKDLLKFEHFWWICWHSNISKANSHRKQKKQFSGKTDKANHHSTPAQQILMKHLKQHPTQYIFCKIKYCCNNCRKFLITDFAQLCWQRFLKINTTHQHETPTHNSLRKSKSEF